MHNLVDLRTERGIGKVSRPVIGSYREIARSGMAVVVVERLIVHRAASAHYLAIRLLARFDVTGHAPVLATCTQRITDTLCVRVEKAYFALGHKLLKFLIRHERKIHAVRIWPYQHHALEKHKID
jgi:hypothetical protein